MSIMENFKIAMEIMGLGMVGIFTVILVLMLTIVVLGKLPSGKKDEESQP